MDAWNTGTHGRSGLTDRVRASTVDEAEAERRVIEFLQRYVRKGNSPMCGNSICQDRRFLAATMPALEAFFHYRNLDVSTLKELARRWRPELLAGFRKAQAHTALADIQESIDELAYYREHFLQRAAPVRRCSKPAADVESRACRKRARSTRRDRCGDSFIPSDRLGRSLRSRRSRAHRALHARSAAMPSLRPFVPALTEPPGFLSATDPPSHAKARRCRARARRRVRRQRRLP